MKHSGSEVNERYETIIYHRRELGQFHRNSSDSANPEYGWAHDKAEANTEMQA